MNFQGHRAEQLPPKFAGDDPYRLAPGSRISRRALLSGSGTAVVAASVWLGCWNYSSTVKRSPRVS